MQSDVFQIVNEALKQLPVKMNTQRASDMVATGAGLVEKSGDVNYIKAVVLAESLAEITGARPSILEERGKGYIVSWLGEEKKKATEYFRSVAINSVTGEPPAVYVDFVPVVSPLVVKYAVPVFLVSLGIAFKVGQAVK